MEVSYEGGGAWMKGFIVLGYQHDEVRTTDGHRDFLHPLMW